MRDKRLNRPLMKSDFEIFLETKSAEKGWQDFVATRRSEAVATWDALTKNPLEVSLKNYRLKSNLGIVRRNGKDHERWQHKPSLTGDVRIWFFVIDKSVFIERIFTSHPNLTK